MNVKEEIVKSLKNKELDTWRRTLYRVILGEFDRVNDGKPITEEESLNVIKKMVKNSREILKYKPDDPTALKEINELENFLPLTANEKIMNLVINEVLTDNSYKNKMQAMKPCIDRLTGMGLDVDKGKLSKLLKES